MARRTFWSERRTVAAVVLAALAVRLLVALPGLHDPEASFFRPDSGTYVQPARAVLDTGGLLEAPESTRPATRRPPVTSLVLAALFGLSGRSLVFPALVLCLISALTCIPILLTGKRFGGPAVGRLAALLFAMNVTSIAAAPLYLSDSLFVFLVAWQLFFVARFHSERRSGDLLWAAALTGVAALTRTAGFLWIVPWAVLAAVAPHPTGKRRAVVVAAGVLIFATCVVPWMMRNRAAGAGFRTETTVGEVLYYSGATLVSVETSEPASAIRTRWQKEDEATFAADPGRFPDEASRVDYKLDRLRSLIREHPWAYARLHVQPAVLLPDVPTLLEHFGLTQRGRGTVEVLHREGILAATRHYFGDRLWLLLPLIPCLLLVMATYLGCAVELGRWVKGRRGFWGVAFLAFVLYYLVLPGPMVEPRYQLPALPLMTIMAASAMVWAAERWRARRAAKTPSVPRKR